MNPGTLAPSADGRVTSAPAATRGIRIAFIETYEARGSAKLSGAGQEWDALIRIRNTAPLRRAIRADDGCAVGDSVTEISAIVTGEYKWEKILGGEPASSHRNVPHPPRLFSKKKPQFVVRWTPGEWAARSQRAVFEYERGWTHGNLKAGVQWSTDRANEIDLCLTDESKGKSLPRNISILPATVSGELKSSSSIRLTIPLWRSDSAAKRTAIRNTAKGMSLFSAALWLGVLLFASGLLASAFQHELPMGLGPGTAMRAGFALMCGALVPRFFQNGAYGLALGLVLIVGNMYFVREGEVGLYLAGALLIAYDLFPGLIARGLYVVAFAFGGAAVFGESSTGSDRAWFGAISVAALLMAIHLTGKQARMEKQR